VKIRDKNKTIISIVAILIMFIACFFSGYFIQKNSSDKSDVEYQNTISQLGSEIEGLQETNRRIENSNTELREGLEQLSDNLGKAQERIRESEDIIDSIGNGLSESSNDIQSIIEAVERVIEAIEEFENLE